MSRYAARQIFGSVVSADADVDGPDKGSGGKGRLTTRLRAAGSRGRGWMAARWVLLPTGNFRLGWDAASVILVLWIAALLPYRIAFGSTSQIGDAYELTARIWPDDVALPSVDFLAVFDFFIDLFFLTDIVLNFFTAYNRDGDLVVSHGAIARQYIKTWLLLDLASSIPFDWFIFGISFVTSPAVLKTGAEYTQAVLLLRVIKGIKLLRLLRIARLYRYVQRLQDHFIFLNSGTLRLMKVGFIMLFFTHWNGCFQFLLATFESREYLIDVATHSGTRVNLTAIAFHPESWVSRMIDIGDLNEGNAWSWAFFNSISQMLAISLNAGEAMGPKRNVELYGYMVSVLFGALLYGTFLSSLTSVISEADASAKAYASKLDMVNQYMRHTRLPRALRSKMRKYYEIFYPSKRSFDEKFILGEISRPLRQAISVHKCRGVLDGLLGAHAGKESALAGAIAQQLERVVYVAGDFVIREGEESLGMTFVSSGQVSVLSADDEVLTTLGDGGKGARFLPARTPPLGAHPSAPTRAAPARAQPSAPIRMAFSSSMCDPPVRPSHLTRHCHAPIRLAFSFASPLPPLPPYPVALVCSLLR